MSHKVCITLFGSAQDPIRLVRPGGRKTEFFVD